MPRPYTIRYGAWAPDLNAVGVEMPMQWTDTEIPTADCSNVYWQDGAYRSMPAAASFGPTLGVQALGCFSWYDGTQGKEVVFGATANGVYQLIDGVWSEISTQTSSNALGLALTIKQGSPVCLATSISPTSQAASGTATSHTFNAITAVIGYGTATSYTWSFSGQTGPGTWAVSSGQGTASATPQVTGSTSGTTSTATCTCSIVFSGTTYTLSSAVSYTQNAFAATTNAYTTAGSGTETVPSGASNVVIEIWGGGGGGGGGDGNITKGGGGGGAGYARSSYACSGGQTIAYTVGAGGSNAGVNNGAGFAGTQSSASSGTLSITTMTAHGGAGGTGDGSANSNGGSASGGNQANATGGQGLSSGTGGSPTAGVYSNTGASNGKGGNGNLLTGVAGAAAMVSFHYT